MKCFRCNRWPCDCRDGITLVHGDVREVYESIDCGDGFPMILADPPYDETSIDWDRWPEHWINAVYQLSSTATSLWCFGSARMFLEHAGEFRNWRFVQDVIWEKHNGSGFMVDRFRRVHESAYHFVPALAEWSGVYKSPQFTQDATPRTVRRKQKPAHWTGGRGPSSYTSQDGGPRQMRSVQYVRSCHGRAVHPTQKPIGILTPLIEYSLPPDGMLFVPFVGGGSELVAAKELGRRAIGVEISEAFCEASARRLSQGILI